MQFSPALYLRFNYDAQLHILLADINIEFQAQRIFTTIGPLPLAHLIFFVTFPNQFGQLGCHSSYMGRANGWSGQHQPLSELAVVQLNGKDYLTIMKIMMIFVMKMIIVISLAPKCYRLHNLTLRIKG